MNKEINNNINNNKSLLIQNEIMQIFIYLLFTKIYIIFNKPEELKNKFLIIKLLYMLIKKKKKKKKKKISFGIKIKKKKKMLTTSTDIITNQFNKYLNDLNMTQLTI